MPLSGSADEGRPLVNRGGSIRGSKNESARRAPLGLRFADYRVEARCSTHLWQNAGEALLEAARGWAEERGAAQLVFVWGPHEPPKRSLLLDAGLLRGFEMVHDAPRLMNGQH